MKNQTNSPTSRAPLGLLAAAALLLPACNIAGPLYYAVAGPGDVDAVLDLDKDRPTVIFVDDPGNRTSQRRFRAVIGETAQELLLRKKVIAQGNMIDTRSAMAAAMQETRGERLSVTEIGTAVDAEVVIYALITDFALAPDGVTPEPTISMQVKVFDAVTHQRVWPAPGNPGYPLTLTLPPSPSFEVDSRETAFEVQQSLAELGGVGLAELFYDVEITRSVRR